MFRISLADPDQVVMEGRLDAAQAPRAQEFLDRVAGACVLIYVYRMVKSR